MNKYIKALCLGTLAVGLGSCSDNYLEVKSESDFTSSTVFATTDMIDGAVNGLSLIMSTSYSSTGFGMQGYNGEATIILWYGAYGGGDSQYSNATSYRSLVNRTFHLTPTSGTTVYPWFYYYRLIANANNIILNVDAAEGADSEKQFYKAQALTYRAHAYSQLVQMYSKRWCDSNNGSSRGVPLRLDESTGDLACSSLAAVYRQIYDDLDEAIALYAQSGMSRGDELWRPDASVAHAIYSRAALAREDWSTAATHAAAARVGYSLMSANEYKAGFNTANSEWMWETYTSATENLGVYGFFAYCGSNTPSSKGYKNIGTISKDLIDQIPENDARRWCYMVPLEGEDGWSTNDSGRATNGTFFTRVKEEYGDYIYSATYIYPYMSVKFRTITDRSIGCVSIIRAAEMIYNEAEALCHVGGQEAKVRQLLEEAVAPYQSGYTCSLSGEALLNEVKLYRRFDLWSEGRSWFDMKRWNEPLVRKSWADGGNWHPDFSGTGAEGGSYGVDDRNGWTICIPEKETDYNALINNNVEPANWSESSAE